MRDYWEDVPLPARFRNLFALFIDYWPLVVFVRTPRPVADDPWAYLLLAGVLAWLGFGAVMSAHGRTQSLGQYLAGIRVCRPIRDPEGKHWMTYPGLSRTALAVAVDALLCTFWVGVPIGWVLIPLMVLLTKRHHTPGQLLANVLPIDKHKAVERMGDSEWLVDVSRGARDIRR